MMTDVRRPPGEISTRGSTVTRRDLPTQPWAPVASPAGLPANVTTRVSERLQEKARARSRLRWRTVARRAGYAAVVAFLAWLAVLSPLFALEADSVEVSGFGTVVDEAAVRAVIAQHEGSSLVLLNVEHVRNQLTDVPGVREVVVERVWPAGLIVTLTSREPVAAIPDPAGGLVLVDDEGVEVARSVAVPDNVPLITVPVGPDHVRVLEAVLRVVRELPATLLERVEGIRADTEDSVQFTLRDGPQVEWGSAEQSALKAEVLQVLLESDRAAGADVIDVSAPTLPITRSE
ncbi:MAG: peptidase S9 [Actinobacteria bacterium HGW-Actinobacteria-4]|nr:MAG: peptidase S9 [Actinobacteria bacterium HGW-Actinobacteria-4]